MNTCLCLVRSSYAYSYSTVKVAPAREGVKARDAPSEASWPRAKEAGNRNQG